MGVNIFSVVAILLCLTFVIVWGDTPSEPSTAGRSSAMIRRQKIRQQIRCFYACKRANSPARATCDCKSIDCKSNPCAEGEECKMIRGVFRVCLKDKAVCDLPKSAVACDASTPSFYYNKDTMMCEKFSDGECADNLNVFQRRGQCYMTCRRPDRAVCELPKATSSCDSTTPGYFFNKDTKRCEQFNQGECGSNKNMFPNRRQCMRTCRSRRGPFRPRPGGRRGPFRFRPRPGARRGSFRPRPGLFRRRS